MACLRARGIYYYLDLLDFRRFLPGDGVVNASALGIAGRPYAVFDPKLVDLQQEYARQLLLTKNPYTNLPPIADPALVMVELMNENGLFMSVTDLQNLAEPYAAEFRRLWNEWLLNRYTTRGKLADRWAAAQEPLAADEDPERGTVVFRPMPSSESNYVRGGVKSARFRDQVQFLSDTQRAYFRTMRDYLRRIGLRCPITAAVTSVIGPDVLSVADELDCTAENYYADHPKYPKEWIGDPYYSNLNAIGSSGPWQIGPQIAVLRWNNKPVVVREWNTAWPNRFRCTAVPDMASYASLQDLDMVILFTYVCGPAATRLMDFSVTSDPTVWGQFGIGAKLFLSGLLDPARYSVDLLYGDYDLEHWGPYLNQLHRLSWCSEVRNVSDSAVSPPAHGISVLSGRGGSTMVPATNSLVFQRLDAVPPPDRVAAVENVLQANAFPLTTSPLATQAFTFNGLIYDDGQTRDMETEVGFLADLLKRAGYAPVGVDVIGQMAFGAYDRVHHRMALPLVTAEEGLRASLDLLHEEGAETFHQEVVADLWHSDTGQIVRDCPAGRLIVFAPRCAMISGQIEPNQDVEDGPVRLRTANPVASLMMISLDGVPLTTSRAWLAKMVTRAENTGQILKPSPPNSPASFVLTEEGDAPIVTFGGPSPDATVLSLNRRPILEIGMIGGTWELESRGDQYELVCDTAGVRVRAFPALQPYAVSATGKRTPLVQEADGAFIYPPDALAVEIGPGRYKSVSPALVAPRPRSKG